MVACCFDVKGIGRAWDGTVEECLFAPGLKIKQLLVYQRTLRLRCRKILRLEIAFFRNIAFACVVLIVEEGF